MTLVQQVVHLLKNDARRFWPLIVGVCLFMTVQIAGFLPQGGVGRVGRVLPIGLFPLVLGVVAAIVVQRDSPFDDRAFWTTRPICPAAVLFAKLAFIGTFLVALPVAVQAAWFGSLGAGAVLAPISADSALYLAGIVAVAAACGSVTRSLRGVLTFALVTWLGVSVLRSVITAPAVPAGAGIWSTRLYLEHWLWMLLGIGFLSHQYVTRKTVRTLVAGGMALLVGLPATRRSELDWSTEAQSLAEPTRPASWDGAQQVELYLVELRRGDRPRADGSGVDQGFGATISFLGGPGALFEVTRVESRAFGRDGELALSPPAGNGFPRMGSRFVRPGLPDMELAGGRVPASAPGWPSEIPTSSNE